MQYLSRIHFSLICTLLLCISPLMQLQAVALETKARPNFLLILCDDLGWADLGCYGADLHETPNIDALAASGIRFTHAYSAAPVCSPTRAALMTGLHPARIPITIWSEGATKPDQSRKLLPGHSLDHLPQTYETLAEKLNKAGYRTALVGKWHLGDGDNSPETQGFEVNVGGTRWGAPPTFFWPYKNNTRFHNEFRYVPGLDFGREGDFLTDKLTDKAIEIIENAGKDPFFLYLAHYAPHTPIECPEPLKRKYQMKLKPEFNHQNETYAGMIENLDMNIGRVISHLKKTGKYDNTMIIFTSDNGGYLGDKNGRNGAVTSNAPLRSGKGSLYEGGIRVPLIMKPPGTISSGKIIGHRVASYDLHQTILQLSGVLKGDQKLDGVDLTGLISEDNRILSNRPLFFHYPHYYETTTPVSAVIFDSHKLLHYDETGQIELYDLNNDPAELHNIKDQSPEMTNKLLVMLNNWKNSIRAESPKPNPNFKVKS